MIYPMNPITRNPIAHACKIFMYSITDKRNAMGGTILVGLGTFVEEDDGVISEVLQLVDHVLVFLLSVSACLAHISLIT